MACEQYGVDRAGNYDETASGALYEFPSDAGVPVQHFDVF